MGRDAKKGCRKKRNNFKCLKESSMKINLSKNKTKKII